jgi:hypothetical protein
MTPNKMIPLNDRPAGQIADIAWQQLKPYREAAQTWPIGQEVRESRTCMVCRRCNQSVWFMSDMFELEYQYQESEKLALIVAHIRQRHTSDEGVIDDE